MPHCPAGPFVPVCNAATPVAASGAENAALLLDDPHEWPVFGKPLGGTANDPHNTLWESHVVLQGMHCTACALTVEEALRRVAGVREVQVSAATRRTRIVWHPAQVLPSQWMQAVAQAGYRALPAQDALAREERQREQRRALWRWLVAGFCMMQVMMYAWPAYQAIPGDLTAEMEHLLRWASWVISLPVVFFACGPFFSSALRDILQRRISMDLPVALGMLITFVVSMLGTFDPTGLFGREVYYDSLTMFVFFLLTGRWLELRLRNNTFGALEGIMNRLPDSVERRAEDGRFVRVAVRCLQVGDVVRVLTGEAFPADGRILHGHTLADEALLTGESTPVDKPEGSQITAGSYNLHAPVVMSVERLGADTRFGEIVALMESASLQKPRLAQLADRIARPFLLAVLLAAVLAAAWWWPTDPGHALMVATAVLIVTCPCALSLATPTAMLAAAGTLARQGVLVRNLQALEALASVDTVIFDKTGTLTSDHLTLRAVHVPQGSSLSEQQALQLAAQLARQSLHPASRALVAAVQHAENSPEDTGGWAVDTVQEVAGSGLIAHAQYAGSTQTLRLGSPAHTAITSDDTTQHIILAVEHAPNVTRELARFELGETLRPQAQSALRQLQQAGVAVELLSGDRTAVVQRVATQAGIATAHGDCTPQDKLQRLRSLQAQGKRVAMTGDGLNDGPVLAGAHASFAFGRAVPLAQSRSDFVALGDNLHAIPHTLLLARRTMRIVRQNLGWAAAYNALCVPLAAAGYMPAWAAGLGMALSSLLVIANAARLTRSMPNLAASHLPPTLPGVLKVA